MPDKNPDAGPPVETGPGADRASNELLRHTAPPGLKRYGRLAIVVAVVIAAAGIGWRLWKGHTTAEWTDDQAVPTVQIIKVANTKNGNITLPGEVQAFTSAPIYAQVTGYLQKWNYDIGAKVKMGALLAQIDPRTYQAALDQARGAMARDSATLANTRVDLTRYQTLAAQNAISAQQLATQRATVDAQAGIVEADKAQVQQASINLAYTRIIAPFDGTVTSRAVDVGNLVMSGTPSNATPLFTVSDQSKMRIYVRVPQNYGSYIRPGMKVTFTVPQHPGRTFQANLVASSGAVAASTGTVLVQFGLDNSDTALQPGAYAEVKFPLPAGANGIRVPATALMFRDEGMQVATVGADNRVKLKTIVIARDLGAAVDVGGGISPSDRIIDNPTDALQDGDQVRVAKNR
jgi:RND family efflux transporter MFP subunit